MAQATFLKPLQLGHAFSRVETKSIQFATLSSSKLQLGHAFSRVETRFANAM